MQVERVAARPTARLSAARAPRFVPRPLDRAPGWRANVIWTGAGNAAYAATQYGLLMVLAKLSTPLAVGQFTLAQAIVTPVIAVSQMQLRQVQVTDMQGEASAADYLGLRGLATLGALAAVAMVAAIIGGDRSYLIILGWVALAKAAESQSDGLYGAFQRRDRLDLVSLLLAARGVVGLGAFAVTLALTRSTVAASAALALSWIAALAVVELPALVRLGGGLGTVDPARMRRIARATVPLAVAAGLVAFSSNFPRYVLDARWGKSEVALYSVALAPVSLMGLFTGALSQATLTRAASAFQRGDAASFRRVALLLTGVNVAVGLACVALFAGLSGDAVSLLFTPAYARAAPVMTVMALGVALGGLGAFGSTVLLASRRFDLQLYNIVVGVLVQLPTCLLLVGRYGAVGAGWSEVIRFAACALYFAAAGAWVYRRRMRAPEVIGT